LVEPDKTLVHESVFTINSNFFTARRVRRPRHVWIYRAKSFLIDPTKGGQKPKQLWEKKEARFDALNSVISDHLRGLKSETRRNVRYLLQRIHVKKVDRASYQTEVGDSLHYKEFHPVWRHFIKVQRKFKPLRGKDQPGVVTEKKANIGSLAKQRSLRHISVHSHFPHPFLIQDEENEVKRVQFPPLPRNFVLQGTRVPNVSDLTRPLSKDESRESLRAAQMLMWGREKSKKEYTIEKPGVISNLQPGGELVCRPHTLLECAIPPATFHHAVNMGFDHNPLTRLFTAKLPNNGVGVSSKTTMGEFVFPRSVTWGGGIGWKRTEDKLGRALCFVEA
jgi:hypothetical protein